MNIDIIRAWKDRSYRDSLSAEEQALLPENPVGQIELTDEELKEVNGAQAQTGGGTFNSFGLQCGGSQGGVCQSVQGSACISQQGNCGSQAGNCPSGQGMCRTVQGMGMC